MAIFYALNGRASSLAGHMLVSFLSLVYLQKKKGE